MTKTETEIRQLGLMGPLELYEDQYSDGDKRLIRLYITSHDFGILALGEVFDGNENKTEWRPIYPRLEIKSYPLKGNWNSPNKWYTRNPNNWQAAVLCAIDPEGFNFGNDEIAERLAKTGNEYRKTLRAEMVRAILKGGIV